jgi:hypothetical protein
MQIGWRHTRAGNSSGTANTCASMERHARFKLVTIYAVIANGAFLVLQALVRNLVVFFCKLNKFGTASAIIRVFTRVLGDRFARSNISIR